MCFSHLDSSFLSLKMKVACTHGAELSAHLQLHWSNTTWPLKELLRMERSNPPFLCSHFLLDGRKQFLNRNLLEWPHTEHKFLTFIKGSPPLEMTVGHSLALSPDV